MEAFHRQSLPPDSPRHIAFAYALDVNPFGDRPHLEFLRRGTVGQMETLIGSPVSSGEYPKPIVCLSAPIFLQCCRSVGAGDPLQVSPLPMS